MLNQETDMARRNDHSRDELKTLTLAQSLKIAEKEGMAALTARRIANEIGYTPGTLYNIFGSMDGLYYEMNALTMQRLAETLSGSVQKAASGTPRDRIKAITNSYLNFARKNKHLWIMLFNTSFEHEPPDWYAEKIEGLFSPLEAIIAEIFSKMPKQKIKLLARTYWASIHGICYLEITRKGPLRKNLTSGVMTDELIERFFGQTD